MLRSVRTLVAYLALVALAAWLGPGGGGPNDELTILLHRDGTCLVEGRSLLFDGLVDRLALHAEVVRDESHPYRVSEQRVRILAEPGTLWGPVLDSLQACSAPDVRIWRVRIGRIGGLGTVDLPLDRRWMYGWEIVEMPPQVEVWVTLRGQSHGEPRTRVVLMDRPLGVDGEGFRVLGLQLEAIARYGALPAVLEARRTVVLEDVLEALAILRDVGYGPVRIEGAPPSSWRAEALGRAARELPQKELLGWIREGLASPDPEEQWSAARLLGGYGEAGIPVVVDALDRARDPRQLRALRAAARAIRGSLPVDVDLRGLLAAVARAEARLGHARTRFYDGPVIR